MNIKVKFSILITLFIMIIVSVLTYMSIKGQEKILFVETDKKINALVKNVSDTISEGLISADDLLISSTIMKLKNRNFDIINAYIMDNKGKLLFHSDGSVMKKLLVNFEKDKYFKRIYKRFFSTTEFIKQKIDNNKYIYVYPIRDNNIKLGLLFIEYNFKRIINKVYNTRKRLLSISAIILIIFIIITYLFTGVLLSPIKEFARGAKIIGSGNLDYRIMINRTDELGELANRFNDMTEELKISRNNLLEKELLEKDLNIAREIQMFLIPDDVVKINEVDVARYYKPAHFVGGDYYDIIKIDKSKYGIIITDVSGKGSGAAIIMAVITFIFHSIVTRLTDTAILMKILNERLIGRIPMGRYATGIYIIYDSAKGVFQYTNAGHNNILFYQRKTDRIYELTKAAAMPIGLSPDTEYDKASYRFESGDILLLQTDGIYEAMNKNREEFSLDRIKFILKEYNSYPAAQISEKIIAKINGFVDGAKQHDDMTLIVLKKY